MNSDEGSNVAAGNPVTEERKNLALREILLFPISVEISMTERTDRSSSMTETTGMMEAVIVDDYNKARIEEVPRPVPAEGEALIEISRVQLDVTECQNYRRKSSILSDLVADKMQKGGARLFGHEFVGEIVTLGDGVTEYEIGDRVYAPDKVHGKETPDYHRPGALAEYICLPVGALRTLPDDISDPEGTVLQPLVSAITSVKDARIDIGDVVVIFGTGAMGYPTGQFALSRDAGTVVAVDINPAMLEGAKDAEMILVDARKENPVEIVDELTDEVGADVVFEAAGGNHAHASEGNDPLAQSFQMTRTGGTIVEMGVIPGQLMLRPREYRAKQIRWVNPRLGTIQTGPNTDTGNLAIQLVSDDRISVAETVTHEVSGLDSFDKAVEITLNKFDYGARGPAQIVLN